MLLHSVSLSGSPRPSLCGNPDLHVRRGNIGGKSNKVDTPRESHVQLLLEHKASDQLVLDEIPYSPTNLPSIEGFLHALYDCRKKRSLLDAKHLHVHACSIGLDCSAQFYNNFIPLFVDCESLCDGQNVFNRLYHWTEYAWTSLIHGYADCNDLDNAFTLFQWMQHDSIHPCRDLFVAMLQVCARLKCEEKGRVFHYEIVKEGYETDLAVSSTLMNMYTKCISLVEAQNIFEELLVRNVASWTVLIAGYVEHGLYDEALIYFDQMKELEHFAPNAVTYLWCLKACCNLRNLDKGREIHSEICKFGVERHIRVANTLIVFYSKCGFLVEAQDVFYKLSYRDTASWNALIGGYADNGFSEKAICYFKQMTLENISPDSITYVCSLNACGSIGCVDTGHRIHLEIIEEGFEKNTFIYNSLIDMYAKSGCLAEAREVFSELENRSVVAWTSLISGYVQCGLCEAALNCYEQLQLDGLSPNAVTYIFALKACAYIGALAKGLEIHARTVKEGFEMEKDVCTSFLDMYMKCNAFAEALAILRSLPVRDLVIWNALVAGYADSGLDNEVMKCLEQVQLEGLCPDTITYSYTLKACGSMKTMDRGQEMQNEIVKRGLDEELFLSNAVVDMYAKCGSFEEAFEVFDSLQIRDAVSWNALIDGYTASGLADEALGCLDLMKWDNVSPNAFIFASCLNACGEIGALGRGQGLHAEIIQKGLEMEPFPFYGFGDMYTETQESDRHDGVALLVGNTLVDMYGKCGCLLDARDVFDSMTKRDLVTWNALITAYAQHGEHIGVLCLFQQMRGQGFYPDGITLLSIITACNHAGLVEKGQYYFEVMRRKHNIVPTIRHFNCVADLIGRAGRLEEALYLLGKMPLLADAVSWISILASCRKWSNVELARLAFDFVATTSGEGTAAFSLMSSICADSHTENQMRSR